MEKLEEPVFTEKSTAVSYTQYGMHKDCPRRYKLRYIDKIPDNRPKHPAAARGTNIHDSVESFFNRETEELHHEIPTFKQEMFLMRENHDCKAEEKFCFDADWNPVHYDDPKGAIRGLIDLYFIDEDIADVKEWKTGKMYADHREQRYLYGTAALINHPQVSTAKVTNYYFDEMKKKRPKPENTRVSEVYHRGTLIMAKDVWSRRIDVIKNSANYPPFPSWKCGFCPYSKPNGGPCEFS